MVSEILHTLTRYPKKELALYIHFPFCVDRCHYCDFVTLPYRAHLVQVYMKFLLGEIECWGKRFNEWRVSSVYFGGGTPSLMNTKVLKACVQSIRTSFTILPHAEWTIECNPRSLTPSKFELMQELGFNRWSVGVQTLNDETNMWLGRRHRLKHTHRTAHLLQSSHANWNVDFLLGVPGIQRTMMNELLNFVQTYSPPHISLYMLEHHPETPLMLTLSRFPSIMFQENSLKAWRTLSHQFRKLGYRHYEVSNYALPGKMSRHNLTYWSGRPYLGLGMGAMSWIGHVRWKVPSNISSYMHYVEHACVPENYERLNRNDYIRDRLLMAFRTFRGVPEHLFQKWIQRTHTERAYKCFLQKRWLRKRHGRVYMTESGWLHEHQILLELLIV